MIQSAKSLRFKFTVLVIAVELLILTGLGLFYTHRFSEEVDNAIIARLSVPGLQMSRGELNFDAVSDKRTMEGLLREPYSEGIVIGLDGRVYFSSDPARLDTYLDEINGLKFSGSESSPFSANANDLVTPLQDSTGTYLTSLSPLRPDGKLTRESEQRYRMVLENSLVSIWVEDFSGVKALFDELKQQGVSDIETYLTQHPETSGQCAELVKIIAVNQAAIMLHAAENEMKLLEGLVTTFTPESFEALKQELICIWNGQAAMIRDSVVKTLAGTPRSVTAYFTVCPGYEETLPKVYVSLVDITEQKQAEIEIHRLNQELERRVVERTAQLGAAIYDLENFNYSASHDLRITLRTIDDFSRILLDEYSINLDQEGIRILSVVRENTKKITMYIDYIQAFSRTGRMGMTPVEIDMQALVRDVIEELVSDGAGRHIKLEINNLPTVYGVRTMLRWVLVNLLSNAIKLSRNQVTPRINVGATIEANEAIFFVQENGVGFDMRYVDKLFAVFQRLHSIDGFEGSGIGLAIVKRIVTRHGGRVWAEGKVNEGATIYFSIPTGEKQHEY